MTLVPWFCHTIVLYKCHTEDIPEMYRINKRSKRTGFLPNIDLSILPHPVSCSCSCVVV